MTERFLSAALPAATMAAAAGSAAQVRPRLELSQAFRARFVTATPKTTTTTTTTTTTMILKDKIAAEYKLCILVVLVFPQKGVERLYSAMKEWMEKTCVVFTPKGKQTLFL